MEGGVVAPHVLVQGYAHKGDVEVVTCLVERRVTGDS